MTSLREECETLRRKCSELETDLASVKTERDDYAATVDEFIKDHKRWQEKALTPEKRDRPLGASEANRILAALRSGHQSALYKRVKAVLDQLQSEVKGDG